MEKKLSNLKVRIFLHKVFLNLLLCIKRPTSTSVLKESQKLDEFIAQYQKNTFVSYQKQAA